MLLRVICKKAKKAKLRMNFRKHKYRLLLHGRNCTKSIRHLRVFGGAPLYKVRRESDSAGAQRIVQATLILKCFRFPTSILNMPIGRLTSTVNQST